MDNLEIRHSIPTALQILLTDLNFLGQIKRNKKPCISGRVIVDADTWTGAFYRFCKGENRMNAVAKIEQIFNQTVDAIEAHKHTNHINIIINYASIARDGVSNLKETYQDDPDMKARLDVQLDNIDLQLERFRHLIKGYNDGKANKSDSSKDFPGLNSSNSSDLSSSGVDLFDAGENRMRLRKNKIKKAE